MLARVVVESSPLTRSNRCDEHGSRALDLGLCALDTMRDGEGGTTRRSPVALVNWRMCMITQSDTQISRMKRVDSLP